MTAGSSPLYYLCSEGDVLDAIVAGHYGDTLGGKVEAVLAVNPHLPRLGAVLEAGVRVALPSLNSDEATETVQLWG